MQQPTYMPQPSFAALLARGSSICSIAAAGLLATTRIVTAGELPVNHRPAQFSLAMIYADSVG